MIQPHRSKPHKGRLQPIINRLPDTIGIIFDALLPSLIVKSGLYLLRLPVSAGKRDRSGVFLANLCSVLMVMLDNCQIAEKGLIAVPHGSVRGTRKRIGGSIYAADQMSARRHQAQSGR